MGATGAEKLARACPRGPTHRSSTKEESTMSRLCTTHPSAQKLAAFGLGKLAGAAADAIARHIESCDACRHEVENVPADPFLGLIRSVGRPTPTPLDLPPELAAHPRFKVVRELGRG